MDSFFDNYPYSYNNYPYSYDNYYSTPRVPTYSSYQPPLRTFPPSWFADNYHPTPAVPTTPTLKEPLSIPVTFIGSDRKKPSRSDYAVKIQKVFRGFRVRRNVKKILEINRAVDDVEKGMSVELMMRDERERLKVNETLMGLLFKLDSVGGINDAVRVCRKAVIRKAIVLQEKIDSLAVSAAATAGGLKDEETLEIDGKGGETLTLDCEIDKEESTDEIDAEVEAKLINCGAETLGNHELEIDGEIAERTQGDQMQVENNMEVVDDVEAWECVGEEEDNVEFVDANDDAAAAAAAATPKRRQLNDEWFVLEESKRNSNKLLEKIAEDNQRLIAMVADLCHKNATQTGLISSLSDRVDKLEQAMNERSRRKKEKKKKKISALKQFYGPV